MYIVSACLLGCRCKYNGGSNRNEKVIAFLEGKSHCVVCPEKAAGLPVPRPPAERQGGRICDREGCDLTQAFRHGAELSLDKARKEAKRKGDSIEGAILKANSPSCGCGQIYDGTFTGTLMPGDGVFSAMLKDYGVNVITEKEIEKR